MQPMRNMTSTVDGQKLVKKLCSPALLSGVLMLSSDFWIKSQHSSFSIEQVPWKKAFLTFQRSKEELELLKEEMICTVSYLLQRKTYITNKLCELDTIEENLYLKGAKCLLERLK